MINNKRILTHFMTLAKIESPSFNEREMADYLKNELTGLGFSVSEDDAGEKLGGTAGNVFATLEGNIPGDALLFVAHMDTVKPCVGKQAIEDNGVIRSKGDTVLGADDLSGVVEILEAMASIKEDGASHRSIEVLFTVSEEFFLKGSEYFDASQCKAREAYILDVDGDIGTAVLGAPTGIRFIANVRGRSAHAAIAPEEGINAIQIAAAAIADMRLGRLDMETTASIGIISGGTQGNIVPDKCFVEGETRSLSADKAYAQCEHMRDCFINAAEKLGGVVEFEITKVYDAYRVSEKAPVAERFAAACQKVGVTPVFTCSTGGSDNSMLSNKGLQGIVLASGMHEIHSTSEYTRLNELVTMTEIVEKLMKSEN